MQGLAAVTVAEILWALLALRMAAGGLRVGAALRRLPLAAAGGDGSGYTAVLGPSASPDAACVQRAAAWADANGIDVLHLLPRRATAGYAWMAGFVLDRASRQDAWLEAKETTGWATLVRDAVLDRAELSVPARIDDGAALIALQKRLSRYGRTAVAVADGGELAGPDPFGDRAGLEESLNADQALVVGPALMLSLLLAGPFVAPWAGTAALVLYALQQLLALPGAPVRVPVAGLLLSPVTRLPWQIGRWLRTLLGPPRRLRQAEVEALRPVYAELLAGGIDRFFEPRQTDCPLCGGSDLAQALRTVDLWQGKPGTFTIEACAGCGHLFQNPRLSVEGLGFYYRDFYDGLGGEDLETLFSSSAQPYAERARAVTARGSPTRWLDVGCGHGHFCWTAKELLPDCAFDGLDLSDSVLDAQRRGWLDGAHRGLFPELAPQLAGRYDAVSMSHYLEHTTDPRAEIAAAAAVLRPGGHLMIEVPDPGSWMRRVLGPLWMPWFQPQHLHFVSRSNLAAILEENGLEARDWEGPDAHVGSDAVFAAWSLLRRIAPVPGMPWNPPPSRGQRAWHASVWTAGVVLLIGAVLLDRLTARRVATSGGSNAYRVVARRR